MTIDFHAYSDIGGREENEDTVAYRDFGPCQVALIADGLGGHGDGKRASRSVCESLLRCAGRERLPTQAELAQDFDLANRELLLRQSNTFHMKTTAVCLCLSENRAIWGHIGDSRLYHVFQNELCDYTLDHSASQLAVFMGEITRGEIPGHVDRSSLLKALGVRGARPEIHAPVTLAPGRHLFLLCTDGLWEYLDDETIVREGEKAASARELIEALLDLHDARCGSDCDNHSALALYVRI